MKDEQLLIIGIAAMVVLVLFESPVTEGKYLTGSGILNFLIFFAIIIFIAGSAIRMLKKKKS